MKPRLTGPPNPFEAYLLVAAALSGSLYLFGEFVPPSIETTLPPLMRTVWASSLLVGGLTALVGLFWPGHPITAIMIKRTGLIFAGFGTLAYSIALATVFGMMAFGTVLSNFAFTVACIWRAAQVTIILRESRKRYAVGKES